jgi:glyoxylase-like metal-dependent hydrolase (beta-lactamase superfamily II)
MKRATILTTIVVAGLTAVTVSAQRGPGLPPAEPIEKVGDNLYKIFGGGGNTTVFVREDGVVLVDTKMPGNGEAILSEVRKVTDKPIVMIINTHSHPDHLGSNDFFKKASPTVDVVMHENAATSAASGPFANDATVPDFTFTNKASLGKGKDKIDLYYFGPGHTNGDAFVVFPAEKAMAIGDLMAWDMGPVIDTMSGGSAVALPETLDKAVAGIKDVDTVIEGHGKVDDWATFLGYVGYTHKMLDTAKWAVARNKNYVEAYDEFAKDRAMAPYTGEQLMKGLEYGGTPKSRTLNNLYIAMKQLRGEPVPMTMGAPPPPDAK